MKRVHVAGLTLHESSGWLNDDAPLNMNNMLVTWLTSQASSG
jgi:hypothetical protein